MVESEVKIIIAGDLFPVPTNFDKFSVGDVNYLFGERICRLFRDASLRICNLEGALTDNPGKCMKTGPVLYAPTSTIRGIKDLGIDCCTLANNHITDAGAQGVIDTLNTLDKEKIQYLGAGLNSHDICHFQSFEVGNRILGLYNVAETMYNEPSLTTPGAFLYDEYIVCKEIEAYKEKCDYLIVVYHGGSEKFRFPSPQTRKRFHRMVDSGANMILSQHTHCIGSEEYYKGAYLLYGQGNFLFRSFNNEFTDTGLIIELFFDKDLPIIKKHLVQAVGDRVEYDKEQDFTSFNERSSHLSDELYLTEKFRDYCKQEVFVYLNAYKGKYPFYKLLGRISSDFRNRFVRKSYSRNQLLLTLHSLRSEQNREIAIEGIKTLLESKDYS